MNLPVDWAIPQAVAFVLVVARMSGLFLLAPVFSSAMIPGRIKVITLIVLSASLTPVIMTDAATLPTDALGIAVAVGTQALVGFAIGFSVSIVFASIQVGASLVDTTMGFSMANIIDPLNSAQGALFGSFYTMIATLSFLSINGHYWILSGFVRSFHILPLGHAPDFHRMLAGSMSVFLQMFVIAFQIAAPVIVTLLLVDCVLGIVARVVPQMNVFFVGIPLKIGVGMTAVIVSLPAVLHVFQQHISDVIMSTPTFLGGG